jgi:purine-binding chemotaxis protein CheW
MPRAGEKTVVQADGMGSLAGKYLSFHLGDEEYAVPVLKVMEIIGLQDITPVPQTPNYVRGVMNLRGKIVPVLDLRLKFHLPEIQYSQRTCIIVVQIASESGPVGVGLIVDAVSEVLQLTAGEIENAADLGLQIDLPYLLGIAKTKERVRMLVSIDELLSRQDVSVGQPMADAAEPVHT